MLWVSPLLSASANAKQRYRTARSESVNNCQSCRLGAFASLVAVAVSLRAHAAAQRSRLVTLQRHRRYFKSLGCI